MKRILILTAIIAAVFKDLGTASLALTIRGYGVGLGNTKNVKGIRLNFVDEDVKNVYGLHQTLWKPRASPRAHIYGVNLGIIGFDAEAIRGLPVAIIGLSSEVIRGITITGIGLRGQDVKGFTLAGSGAGLDNVDGISIAGIGMGAQRVRGVFVGGIGMGATEVTGLAIAGIGVGF